MFGIKSYSVST